jgi:hypothetical protein
MGDIAFWTLLLQFRQTAVTVINCSFCQRFKNILQVQFVCSTVEVCIRFWCGPWTHFRQKTTLHWLSERAKEPCDVGKLQWFLVWIMWNIISKMVVSLYFERLVIVCLMQANSIIQGGKLTQLVDPYLPTQGHTDEVEKMTLAASLCIRQAPQNCPQMDAVCFLLTLQTCNFSCGLSFWSHKHLGPIIRFWGYFKVTTKFSSGLDQKLDCRAKALVMNVWWHFQQQGVTQTSNPTSILHLMLKMMLPQSAATISSQRTHRRVSTRKMEPVI